MTDPQPTTRARTITIPSCCLVVLIGASGSGKSTFAARHFRPTEVLSSDHYRAVVGDDPNDQRVTSAAFAALHAIADLRLSLRRLTVVDATSVKASDRASLLALANKHHVPAVAIVFNLAEALLIARDAQRTDRQVGPGVIRRHVRELLRGLRGLEREGFAAVHILTTEGMVDGVTTPRTLLEPDRQQDRGPFDIIGDVHGCLAELIALLQRLGYQSPADQPGTSSWQHPDGRRAVFVGDLVDRGPHPVAVVDLVMAMVAAGQALCVPGNHDDKLARYLRGNKVKIAHGLETSIADIEQLAPETREQWSAAFRRFMEGLPSHLVLEAGALVVAHAGMREDLQGGSSPRVRSFALFGETTGEVDDLGLPVRIDWAATYRGKATVVYGHTPVAEPAWVNQTIDIDTGCVFGGRLTALRWPERELVSVPAERIYAESARPLAPSTTSPATTPTGPTPAESATLLRLDDIAGKHQIQTRLMGPITIEAEQSGAALEVLSRFAVDPRWLIYLPPTMSPSETTSRAAYLEYPQEAFDYFQRQGVGQVICEEKHMGSRAVIVLCRDPQVARRRFLEHTDVPGAIFTRTGRAFFEDRTLNQAIITRLIAIMEHAGLWERWATDWVCLDAEIMPWNVKAQELVRTQYGPVATAGIAALDLAVTEVRRGLDRGLEMQALATSLTERQANIAAYAAAYQRYCWPVAGIADIQIAPFHLLATEGQVHVHRDHRWHMAELARLAAEDDLCHATRHQVVDLADPDAVQAAVAWWEALTGAGGEGMVVKPLDFVITKRRGLVQPAIKCRGREYLRIIYGPDYTLEQHLVRLRQRSLHRKRSLAVREFALGIEALERFTGAAPLWQVHQAVAGVLALESEPVDPRL